MSNPFLWPKGVEPSPERIETLQTVLIDRVPIVFLSGKAGTGKSALIRTLKLNSQHLNVIYCAPTGLAAVNIDGGTVHRCFGIPPRLIDPQTLRKLMPRNPALEVVDLIVNDEASMLRADLVAAIDVVLQRAKRNNEPLAARSCCLSVISDSWRRC